MDFELLLPELHALADEVGKLCVEQGLKVKVEASVWDDAPYRTTIAAARNWSDAPVQLYEVQGKFAYHASLKELCAWMWKTSAYGELYVVVGEETEVALSAMTQLRKDGVGLLVRGGNGQFERHLKPRNPRLRINPDPELKVGKYKTRIQAAFEKFNNGDRKDALRDMCEIGEEVTHRVGVKAAGKLKLGATMNAVDFEEKDWNGQINLLAHPQGGGVGVIDTKLKDDLHSLRGGRNLMDHQAKTKAEEDRRQRQYMDRMLMAPRLVAELLTASKKL
jgi:hypothetical protein